MALTACMCNGKIGFVVNRGYQAVWFGVHVPCGALVHIMGAYRALCAHCAKSWLFFTTGSHGSQGPEFCTLQPLLVHQGFFVLI